MAPLPPHKTKSFPRSCGQEVNPSCGSVCLLKQAESGCSEEGFIVCAPSEAAPAGRPSPSQLFRVPELVVCGVIQEAGLFPTPLPRPGPWPSILSAWATDAIIATLPVSSASWIIEHGYVRDLI